MPQFSGYNSRFGGAPAGAARDPSSGGYPSRATNKGRPAQPAPIQPSPPPQYPSPIQGPIAGNPPGDIRPPGGFIGRPGPAPAPVQPPPWFNGPPGDWVPGPDPGERPPDGGGILMGGGQDLPQLPMPPDQSRPIGTPPPGWWDFIKNPPPDAPPPPYEGPPVEPGPIGINPPGPRPPGGILPRPGPGPIGGFPGLSDVPPRQLLMQMLLARRAAAARRGGGVGPYGPGRDWAGYPIPPPGMAGPV